MVNAFTELRGNNELKYPRIARRFPMAQSLKSRFRITLTPENGINHPFSSDGSMSLSDR